MKGNPYEDRSIVIGSRNNGVSGYLGPALIVKIPKSYPIHRTSQNCMRRWFELPVQSLPQVFAKDIAMNDP